MAYTEWGDPDNPRVLVCVHGLTRNGRDFDFLAQALARHCRVVCPDVAGRGRSDWLKASADYVLPVYVNDMITLLARIGAEEVDWVGTSMGGLIGMLIASQPLSPIRRLVLNDVGPVIPAAALRRIAEYVGNSPRFETLEEAEQYLRFVGAPFGPLDDLHWRHLTEHSVRAEEGRMLRLRYDPSIGDPFRSAIVADVDLWPVYDAIRCPTLVIRGEQSDLLHHDTAEAMGARGPQPRVVEIPGVGHAPMLMDAPQIGIVREFLTAG